MIEKRCAIYTRKSHEEGLEQEYNSLDAQRDACESYIKSQAHEGWKMVRKYYDDAGFSGGTLKRPALQDLLQDIRDDNVDVIVVYKIDRLTRSLMDFSNIINILDEAEASFVSVTQHFNTTSSMGRLTLNVLLSFAQFEREITGERIRDKIAASRKKGMWMGGARPIGYDIVDKKLIISEKEAWTVRTIFERYVEFGTAKAVVEYLGQNGIRNKEWISPNGERKGGKPFREQGICSILQNPLYLGKMRFKDEIYEGDQEAILSQDIFDKAQELLEKHRAIRSGAKRKKSPYLLEGIIYDGTNQTMTPTYSTKKGNRNYPYYVSRSTNEKRNSDDNHAMRIPAQVIDELVRDRVETISDSCKDATNHEAIRSVVRRVTVYKNLVELELNHAESGIDLKRAESRGDEVIVQESHAILRIRATLQKRDNKLAFITINGYEVTSVGKPDPILVKNITAAWKWRDMLDTGKYGSIPELCRAEKQSEGYVRRLLPLSFLAPDIIESILDGHQPPSLDLKSFTIEKLPLSWAEQRLLLGYAT